MPGKTPLSALAFALVASAFAGGTSGCLATQRDQEALSARVADAERKAQASEQANAALRADLEATRQRLDNALRANADSTSDFMSSKQRANELAGRVDELRANVDELKRDVTASRTEIYARLDDLKRAQQPTGQAPPPPPPPVAVPQDKAAHYRQIEEAFAKRDWAPVRALGGEYVNRYSSDEKADDVLFLVGQADLSDGRPSSALGHFNRLLKLFPRSNVLDKTLFGMGEAYMTMHDCANAKLAYEACERRFSKEKIGADARAKLQLIAKNPPGLCAPN